FRRHFSSPSGQNAWPAALLGPAMYGMATKQRNGTNRAIGNSDETPTPHYRIRRSFQPVRPSVSRNSYRSAAKSTGGETSRGPGPRLCLGRWLLVPRGRSLSLACRILVAASL